MGFSLQVGIGVRYIIALVLNSRFNVASKQKRWKPSGFHHGSQTCPRMPKKHPDYARWLDLNVRCPLIINPKLTWPFSSTCNNLLLSQSGATSLGPVLGRSEIWWFLACHAIICGQGFSILGLKRWNTSNVPAGTSLQADSRAHFSLSFMRLVNNHILS